MIVMHRPLRILSWPLKVSWPLTSGPLRISQTKSGYPRLSRKKEVHMLGEMRTLKTLTYSFNVRLLSWCLIHYLRNNVQKQEDSQRNTIDWLIEFLVVQCLFPMLEEYGKILNENWDAWDHKCIIFSYTTYLMISVWWNFQDRALN